MKAFDDLSALLAVVSNPKAAKEWLDEAKASEKALAGFEKAEAVAKELETKNAETQRQIAAQLEALKQSQATAQTQADNWIKITGDKEMAMAAREAALAGKEKELADRARELDALHGEHAEKVAKLSMWEKTLKTAEDTYKANVAKLKAYIPNA